MHLVDSCREKNGRCCEDRSNSIQKVKSNCIISFYFCCKEVGLENIDHFVDLLRSKYLLLYFLFFFNFQHFLMVCSMSSMLSNTH